MSHPKFLGKVSSASNRSGFTNYKTGKGDIYLVVDKGPYTGTWRFYTGRGDGVRFGVSYYDYLSIGMDLTAQVAVPSSPKVNLDIIHPKMRGKAALQQARSQILSESIGRSVINIAKTQKPIRRLIRTKARLEQCLSDIACLGFPIFDIDYLPLSVKGLDLPMLLPKVKVKTHIGCDSILDAELEDLGYHLSGIKLDVMVDGSSFNNLNRLGMICDHIANGQSIHATYKDALKDLCFEGEEILDNDQVHVMQTLKGWNIKEFNEYTELRNSLDSAAYDSYAQYQESVSELSEQEPEVQVLRKESKFSFKYSVWKEICSLIVEALKLNNHLRYLMNASHRKVKAVNSRSAKAYLFDSMQFIVLARRGGKDDRWLLRKLQENPKSWESFRDAVKVVGQLRSHKDRVKFSERFCLTLSVKKSMLPWMKRIGLYSKFLDWHINIDYMRNDPLDLIRYMPADWYNFIPKGKSWELHCSDMLILAGWIKSDDKVRFTWLEARKLIKSILVYHFDEYQKFIGSHEIVINGKSYPSAKSIGSATKWSNYQNMKGHVMDILRRYLDCITQYRAIVTNLNMELWAQHRMLKPVVELFSQHKYPSVPKLLALHDNITQIYREEVAPSLRSLDHRTSVAASLQHIDNLTSSDNPIWPDWRLKLGAPGDVTILKGEKDFINEGSEMNHCVASYIVNLAKRGTLILSIKAGDGTRSTAEISIKRKSVLQHLSQHNQPPSGQCKEVLDRYVNERIGDSIMDKIFGNDQSTNSSLEQN